MGTPCKRPGRCSDIEEGVRTVYGEVEWGKRESERVWMQIVTNICSAMTQRHRFCNCCTERERHGFTKMDRTLLPRYCSWRSSLNLLSANLKRRSYLFYCCCFKSSHESSRVNTHAAFLHTLPYAVEGSHRCQKYVRWSSPLCVYTSATPTSHGVMPSHTRSSLLPWCQKKTPHALILPESAERGRCPADLVHVCVSRAEKAWKGNGGGGGG